MTKTDITLVNDAFGPFVRAGWTLNCAVFMFDSVSLFFDNGAASVFKIDRDIVDRKELSFNVI